MKLLIVLSSSDFDNFTRRATVEAICKEHENTTILLLNSVKSWPIDKPSNTNLKWKVYYSFTLGKLKNRVRKIELQFKRLYWNRFIQSFDTVFLTDPNQEILLEHISEKQQLLYLIRDPNVLLSRNNEWKERNILVKNPHVFGISKALCSTYLQYYYQDLKIKKITYWPNTVDMSIWCYEKVQKNKKEKFPNKVAGVIGNLTFKTDLDLLDYITEENPEIRFEIYGKLKLEGDRLERFKKITEKENVYFGGFVPFEELPPIVLSWDLGLVIERMDMDFSAYYDANKRYQYVAMGIPFVSYHYNGECDKFGVAAYIADSKEEYSQKIREALIASVNKTLVEICLKKARENSNEVRAKHFLKLIAQ